MLIAKNLAKGLLRLQHRVVAPPGLIAGGAREIAPALRAWIIRGGLVVAEGLEMRVAWNHVMPD